MKLQNLVTKAVNKTLGKKIAKAPLKTQVEVAKRLMRQSGLVEFRASFLKPEGLPADIKDKLKLLPPEDIKAFYWECPEFREFWTKDLQCTEEMLDLIIKEAS